MSPIRPQLARRPLVARPPTFALLFLVALGCTSDGADDLPQDGSFGEPLDYIRDGGMDAGSTMDAALLPGSSVNVRFIHGYPNLGALTMCHDPDGPGPDTAYELVGNAQAVGNAQLVRAEYRGISPRVALPPLTAGELTLHREAPLRLDAGVDAGPTDGGMLEPCSVQTRAAVIPLPLPKSFTDSFVASSTLSGYDHELRQVVADAVELTMLGSGLALNPTALQMRADQVRRAWLNEHPGDNAGAELRAGEELARVESAYGARMLIQAPAAAANNSFSLSVLHAIPNLTGADGGMESEAIRLCVRAGTELEPPFPRVGRPGVPFRMRAPLEIELNARVEYKFQVFVQSDFDRDRGDCSTSLRPIAEKIAPASSFRPGGRYTLALFGAVSANELCSTNNRSFVQTPCARSASELGPQLDILED
jgi:hypothetical protein